MRERPSIAEQHLRACLQDQYDLSIVSLTFLPLGLDTRAGVFRVEDKMGTPFLVKVKSGALYKPGRLVPRYLHDQGIAAVVAPLPTRHNALWTQLGDWTVTLYPFIEGDRGWTPPLTDTHWRSVGATLKQIHRVKLPPEGMPSLRQEAFDTTDYAQWVRKCDAHRSQAKGARAAEWMLRATWLENQQAIHAMLAAMATLAGSLRRRSGPHVICHADLHPSNMIRDDAGRVFVIDWDDVMLAPKERDLLFVADAPADGASDMDVPPFFQGYGPAEIDWVALTYFRWERIVQDVIECARDVLFRDDLEEETKLENAQLFDRVLAPGNMMVTAAWSAAAHLPPHLGVPNDARA